MFMKLGLALPATAAVGGSVAVADEPASRAVLLAYNEFLFVERSYLAREMFPELGDEAERFLPCSTGAEQAFRCCNPFASTPSVRAVQMLCTAGLSIEKLEARNAHR
tara:strand:- start:173 stop:493 length:321 start_codon:yes stop_codon:yes gene_type:complete